MLGWVLHIAIDILAHRGIFATHFLWPFSSLGWDGTPWEDPWFLAANYITLAAVYLLFFFRGARSARQQRTGNSSAEESRPTES